MGSLVDPTLKSGVEVERSVSHRCAMELFSSVMGKNASSGIIAAGLEDCLDVVEE
jgi:hypothetical protein